MSELKIKVISQNFENFGAKLIKTRAHGEYNYVDVGIDLQVRVGNQQHFLSLVTGLYYENNEYNCPGNTLSVYDDSTSALLAEIDDKAAEFDEEMVAELNEKYDTSYSLLEVYLILESIEKIKSDMQKRVDALVEKADKEL